MNKAVLLISGRLDLRSALKAMLVALDSGVSIRVASDAKIGLGRLHEESTGMVIVDDGTVKDFFEESCGGLRAFPGTQFIKIRAGGRRDVRTRSVPFSFTEIIVPNGNDVDQICSEVESVLRSQKAEPPLRSSPAPMATPTPFAAPPPFFGGPISRVSPEVFLPDILVIGSSTGGPEALERFFVHLQVSFPIPVVVVQHMPAGFTKGLADRLGRMSGYDFTEVSQNQVLKPGVAHIAPGDSHLRLKKAGTEIICGLDKGPLINSVRPAVDPLFETAVQIFGQKVMAIVLTGMGEDGALGSQIVKANGGCVAIQDEATSVVWGMPGSVAKLGLPDATGTPERLAEIVGRQMMRRGGVQKSLPKGIHHVS